MPLAVLVRDRCEAVFLIQRLRLGQVNADGILARLTYIRNRREISWGLYMGFLELKDGSRLLRLEVERAGGQTAWARKTGNNRTIINKALNARQPPSKKIIRALKLRMAFCA